MVDLSPPSHILKKKSSYNNEYKAGNESYYFLSECGFGKYISVGFGIDLYICCVYNQCFNKLCKLLF